MEHLERLELPQRGKGIVMLTSRQSIIVFLLCLALPYPTLAQEYRVGPRDVLDVVIWGQPDLSQRYTVTGDGFIDFPMIGRVKVEDLTTTEIAQRLHQRLDKDYLVNPQIRVSVAEYLAKKVFVLGEAEKPGSYVLTGPLTLWEILSQAGGLSKLAGNQLILIRPQNKTAPGQTNAGRENSIRHFNIGKIQAGEMEENIPLQNGDTILIPRAQGFFVLGEVKNPGAYKLEQETTVLEGITLAGGFTNLAAPGRTRIIRTTPKGEEIIQVDMNEIIKQGRRDKAIRLRENDVIVVPESFF
jgi:polysaccharide export outer membrane protein